MPPGARRRAAKAPVILAATALAALAILRWVIVPYRVDGPSMMPALEDGDVVLVNRLAYLFAGPRRDEVVIRRRAPEGGMAGANEMLPAESVKRVAGLPGETFEVREGVVEGGEPGSLRSGQPYPLAVRRGPYGRSPVALGSGEYFLLGDASHISRDSRSWGPVRREEIDGRVVLVVFPWERFGLVR